MFTTREGGMTSATNQTMLQEEQWLEVGAMQLNDNDIGIIQLSALDIEVLLPEAKAKIQFKAILDDNYRKVCNQVVKKENIDKGYPVKEDLLCYKNRI